VEHEKLPRQSSAELKTKDQEMKDQINQVLSRFTVGELENPITAASIRERVENIERSRK